MTGDGHCGGRASIQLIPIFLRNVVHGGVLAELQDPNVSDDAPAVVWTYSRGVTGHGAKAISDDVEKVTYLALHHAVE